MVYVDANGNVGGKKSWSRAVSDFIMAIINFISLFFSAVTNPPSTSSSSSRTYAQRHQGRGYSSSGGGGGRGGGSNIRGMKNLQGPTSAKMGG
mmetsp:Transcript_24029/g.56811  ORF Transcript_24029/g.56811 Transcript_24029/m.56811 type:complete len:93 (-) Transcript_24029:2221-2499(-)|eukprot:CAMPEP_0113485314 /NCGR_PEP_ID=MMETSP0014_2-20120614/24419_1 /TAXON_ID=2857 /ORGANISM="Nitzschia sp." /LENGTH=92 /DNA_ID=CAMNT_0000378955 /DNA_START=180 /DNA_END=458 /DNA_ORIENTATION=+ /assembly_acc=CAM_ASM_000159